MRLILDRALFAPTSSRENNELLRLLLDAALTEPAPPAIVLDPPYVPGDDNAQADVWLDRRDEAEGDAIRDLLEQGNVRFNGTRGAAKVDPTPPRPAWRLVAAPEVRVDRRADSDWPALRLMLADAIALLHEPVHLVLENARNDLAFVRHLAGPIHGQLLRDLDRAAGRLHVHGGGGGEARIWLEALAAAPLTPEKWRRALRTWVLFDQDAGETDAREPSRDAERFMAVCEQVQAAFPVGVTWICLRRREIESYVPDRGLVEEGQDRQAMVQAIRTWRSAGPPVAGNLVDLRRHAWAFDLKKGLMGDLRTNVLKADRDALNAGTTPLTNAWLKVPFDALDNADVTTMARGLGKSRLNDALTREQPHPPHWTADVPAEYDRGPDHQAPRLDLVQSLLDRI